MDNRIVERNSKRQKLDFAKCFPAHVCEQIFSNLNSKELLLASVVSRSWNAIVAASRQCMEKINLSYKEFPKKEFESFNVDTQLIQMSTRKYLNATFTSINFDKRWLIFFTNRRHWWRAVTFVRCRFSCEKLWHNILESLQPSLISFEVIDCFAYSSGVSHVFPKLKKLKLSKVELGSFAACKTLIDLDVVDTSLAHLLSQRLLVGNSQLKRMSLCGNWDQVSEGKNLCEKIEFRLDELNLERHRFTDLIHKFLETQADCLVSLRISDTWNPKCLTVIFGMSNLTNLEVIASFSDDWLLFDWDHLQLPVNCSVKKLNVFEHSAVADPIRNRILMALILSLPNLKKLISGVVLDNELFIFLSNHAVNLKAIECNALTVAPQLMVSGNPLPNLQTLSVESITCDELRIGTPLIMIGDPFPKLQKLFGTISLKKRSF